MRGSLVVNLGHFIISQNTPILSTVMIPDCGIKSLNISSPCWIISVLDYLAIFNRSEKYQG